MLALAALQVVVSDCDQVVTGPTEQAEWPCDIGVWACGADEESLRFRCSPCARPDLHTPPGCTTCIPATESSRIACP